VLFRSFVEMSKAAAHQEYLQAVLVHVSVDQASRNASCKICNRQIMGSYRTDRAYEHFRDAGTKGNVAICTGPVRSDDDDDTTFRTKFEVWTEFKEILKKQKLKRKESRHTDIVVQFAKYGHTSLASTLVSAAVVTPEKLRDDQFDELWQQNTTRALANAFYCNALSANVVESASFKNAITMASGGRFKMPSSYEVLGPLLNREYEDLQKEMTRLRTGQAKYGIVLVGDGATNTNREPVLNMLEQQGNICIFVECRNVLGQKKSKEYVAQMFIDHIMKMPDPRSVVAVSTDNGVRSSWPIIVEACPWICCIPCGCHVVNLLLKDIGKLPGISTLFGQLSTLRKFIVNHEGPHAIYAENARERPHGRLFKVAGTRFAGNALAMRNVQVNMDPIRRTLRSEALQTWLEQDGNGRTKGKDGTSNAEVMRDLVSTFCSVDEGIWNKMKTLSTILAPIEALLRFVEQDKPTLSKVHVAWGTVIKHLRSLYESFTTAADKLVLDEILQLVYERWDYGYCNLQAVTFMLDPEFLECEVGQIEMDEFYSYLQGVYFELSDADLAQKLAEITIDYNDFRNSRGSFSSPVAKASISRMPASLWWESYALGLPNGHNNELRGIAIKVLACVSGAASSERGHQVLKTQVHTKGRNRLMPERVHKLLYVKMNTQLLHATVDGSLSLPKQFLVDDTMLDETMMQEMETNADAYDLAWMGSAPKKSRQVIETQRKKDADKSRKRLEGRSNSQLGWVTPTAAAIGRSRSGRIRFSSMRVREETLYYSGSSSSSSSSTTVIDMRYV
jgi:hypothetical protein